MQRPSLFLKRFGKHRHLKRFVADVQKHFALTARACHARA